jgi:hypothetical protein
MFDFWRTLRFYNMLSWILGVFSFSERYRFSLLPGSHGPPFSKEKESKDDLPIEFRTFQNLPFQKVQAFQNIPKPSNVVCQQCHQPPYVWWFIPIKIWWIWESNDSIWFHDMKAKLSSGVWFHIGYTMVHLKWRKLAISLYHISPKTNWLYIYIHNMYVCMYNIYV